MLKRLALRSLLVVALIGGLSFCKADSPSAPVTSAPLLASGPGKNLGLLLGCNTRGYGQVTQTIGRSGGSIQVGPHRLSIPAGALRENTRITATAPAGKVILVELEPHGLNFRQQASLTLSYAECGLLTLNPKVAYVGDKLDIYYFLPSTPDLLNRTSTGKLDHFSGYSLAE